MTRGLRDEDYERLHVPVESHGEISLATFHKLIVNGYLLLGTERYHGDDIGKDQMLSTATRL